MTHTIRHGLRGEWHSSEAALRRLAQRLRRKGAGPSVTLHFTAHRLPHGDADLETLVDLTYLIGARRVILPRAPTRAGAPVVRARARKWNVQIRTPR